MRRGAVVPTVRLFRPVALSRPSDWRDGSRTTNGESDPDGVDVAGPARPLGAARLSSGSTISSKALASLKMDLGPRGPLEHGSCLGVDAPRDAELRQSYGFCELQCEASGLAAVEMGS